MTKNLKSEKSHFHAPRLISIVFGHHFRGFWRTAAQKQILVTRRAYSCISSRVIRSQVELVGKFGADGQIDLNDELF